VREAESLRKRCDLIEVGVGGYTPFVTNQLVREWLSAVETELGLNSVVDDDQGLSAIEGLADRVGDHVDATAVAGSAFLVGVAAGRAQEPGVAAQDMAQKLGAMAQGWNSDDERGVPSNDQEQRG
jgi:hypothetical protein